MSEAIRAEGLKVLGAESSVGLNPHKTKTDYSS
jgi:hypothetical protein